MSSSRPDSTDTIAALIHRLQRSGLDLFEQHALRDQIVSRGFSAVDALLQHLPDDPPLIEGILLDALRRIDDEQEHERTRLKLERSIAPRCHRDVRRVSIHLLVEFAPARIGERLLDFAADREHETKDMRLYALSMIQRIEPDMTLGVKLAHLLHDDDDDIVHDAMRALSRYAGIVPPDEVIPQLERLVSPVASLDVRCLAIETLGRFAEIDALERVMLLPLTHHREHVAVQEMVRFLLEKPRSVCHLRPRNFEHLISRLLENYRYEDVQVTGKGSWDDGIDIVAWRTREGNSLGERRVKVVIQCKRFSSTHTVGPDVVDRMVETITRHGATEGLIITTSRFAPAAVARREQHKYIHLIDGQQLQRLLDERLEPNHYLVMG